MVAAFDVYCWMLAGLVNAWKPFPYFKGTGGKSLSVSLMNALASVTTSVLILIVSEKHLHCRSSRMTSLLTPISLLVVARISSRTFAAVSG